MWKCIVLSQRLLEPGRKPLERDGTVAYDVEDF